MRLFLFSSLVFGIFLWSCGEASSIDEVIGFNEGCVDEKQASCSLTCNNGYLCLTPTTSCAGRLPRLCRPRDSNEAKICVKQECINQKDGARNERSVREKRGFMDWFNGLSGVIELAFF